MRKLSLLQLDQQIGWTTLANFPHLLLGIGDILESVGDEMIELDVGNAEEIDAVDEATDKILDAWKILKRINLSKIEKQIEKKIKS